ncbi:MAG: Hpt domain-containing protein [Variovorax sp.]|nr:MAG: Hpt domain-containing protein [Variovorax sp.]
MSTAGPATIDLATFAELQDAAGADFIKELVQTFLEEAPAMLQELRNALAAGDADVFRRAAHSLKSNSLTFGALALGAMARDLELGGLEAAQQSNAKAALDALALEYARVAAALTELAHG